MKISIEEDEDTNLMREEEAGEWYNDNWTMYESEEGSLSSAGGQIRRDVTFDSFEEVEDYKDSLK